MSMISSGIARVGNWLAALVLIVSPLAAFFAPQLALAVAPTAAYDAIPSSLPPNMASLGYQATQTGEFGDYVHLAGTNRVLQTVTLTMSDWALYSDYIADGRYSGNSSTWTHPITVNVYSSHLGANGVPDELLATKTQDITIPWRPAAVAECGSGWKAGDGNCYNGIAFNASFDLSASGVTLPDDVIVGVAYNTNTWGASPIGTSGPYESLNLGLEGAATTGTDDNTNNVFWNTSTPANYTDGGAAGVGIFRLDDNWSPYGTVAMRIDTSAPAPTSVTVTIDKYLNGAQATTGNTGNASFPMHAFYPGGDGPYALSASGFNNPDAYKATTSEMPVGSDYRTYEDAPASCTAEYPFKLAGYTTGDTLEAAAAETPTMTVPAFTGLTDDQFVIVWNKTCPPAPTPVAPADGTLSNNAGVPSVDWTDVTDPASGITYEYEVSNSNATNPDGSLSSVLYGPVSTGADSQITNGGTADGTYYWQARAKDAAGNYGPWSAPSSVTFDSTAPTTPVLEMPANGAHLDTNDFDFTWDASTDAHSVTYVFHSSMNPAETDGVLTDGLWTSDPLTSPMIHSSGAPDGTWYWQVQAMDAAGNTSAWSPIWNVTLDHSAPTATLTFGTPGPSTTGFTVTYSEAVVQSEAEDPANYFLNNWPGAGGSGDLAGDATVSYDADTHVATVSFTSPDWYISGEQQWGVQNVHDLAGHLIDPNPTTAYSTALVNPGAPGAPTTPTPTTSTTQDWTWTAAVDPGEADASGVASYEYSVDGGDWTNIGNTTGVTTNLGVGEHTLNVRAIDNAGNMGDASEGSVTVNEPAPTPDTTAPSVPELTAPSDESTLDTNEFDFTWNASTDDQAGAITYDYQTSQNPAETDGVLTNDLWTPAAPLTETSIHSSGAADGTWYWQVRATDASGNKSAWSPIWSVTLDTTPEPGPDTTAPDAPTLVSPDNNATLTTDEWTEADWTDVSDPSGVTYIYESSHSDDTDDHGFFISPAYNSQTAGVTLTDSRIPTNGTPEGIYYWHVKAVDGANNSSDWSETRKVTVDNTEEGGGDGDGGGSTNTAPIANNQGVSATENADKSITLTGSDADEDALTYTIASAPTHGTLSEVDGDEVVYTPATDYVGADSFTFTVNDGTEDSNTATVSITVNAAPDPSDPVCAPGATFNEGTHTCDTTTQTPPTCSAGTLNTETDMCEGEEITPTAPTCEAGAYNPESNMCEVTESSAPTCSVEGATFHAGSNTCYVDAPTPNNAPVADDLNFLVMENEAVGFTLTGSDADGDSLTYAIASDPTNGTLTGDAPDLVYTPNEDFVGTDSFTYTVNDGTDTSAPATVTIRVDARSGGGGGSSGSGPSPSFASGGGTVSTDEGTTGDQQVLGASTYNFTTDLTLGSTGNDVTELQKILIAAGYLQIPAPTGYFGTQTQAAVKLYQLAHGISPVSGYVGPMTRAALNQGTTPTASDEDSSLKLKALLEQLVKLQAELKANGGN